MQSGICCFPPKENSCSSLIVSAQAFISKNGKNEFRVRWEGNKNAHAHSGRFDSLHSPATIEMRYERLSCGGLFSNHTRAPIAPCLPAQN